MWLNLDSRFQNLEGVMFNFETTFPICLSTIENNQNTITSDHTVLQTSTLTCGIIPTRADEYLSNLCLGIDASIIKQPRIILT